MDEPPAGMERGMKRERDGYGGRGGGEGVGCIFILSCSDRPVSLGEALCVESVLFTARNKLIGADFTGREGEREAGEREGE